MNTDDQGEETLRRDIGFVGAAMLVLNGVVGAGIFALPGTLLAEFGAFSPYVIPLFGVFILLIAIPFGELASYFDRTGGPVAYTREAFGPFVSFQTGWAYYMARVTAFGANLTVFAAYAASLNPALGDGWPRAGLILALAGAITAINVVGVRRAVLALDALSVLKAGPLFVLSLLAIALHGVSGAGAVAPPDFDKLESASLLILYAFIGFETGVVTAGETKDPRRTMPRALVATTLATVALYFLVQLAYASTMAGETVDAAPLVAFGAKLLGPAGAVIMILAALFSISGNLMGSMAGSPRVTYALARDGALPRWFAAVDPRFATPANSILFLGAAAAALALSGSFVFLAVASTLSRLFVYLACLAALPVIRRKRGAPARRGADRFIRILIFWGGVLVCLWAIAQATYESWRLLALLLLAGAALFALARAVRR